jgi:hypothetical protein
VSQLLPVKIIFLKNYSLAEVMFKQWEIGQSFFLLDQPEPA